MCQIPFTTLLEQLLGCDSRNKTSRENSTLPTEGIKSASNHASSTWTKQFLNTRSANKTSPGCLSEIGVPVTKELGFHQLDIRGSPYGLLAAHPLAPLVSLHHFDYFESIFPNLTQIDSVEKLVSGYEVDPSRILQQSFCYDLNRNWSVSVSWGYTVQFYPFLVTAKKLETAVGTFQTWRSWDTGPFTFNTQPISSDMCERPVVFMLDRVESVGGGKTLTGYKRYNMGKEEKDCPRCNYTAVAVQFFNVSAPKFNPDLWNKAPRRQCCEIINGTDGADNVVHVQIRGCKRFESVSPH
ncbi:uncharacterized protein LOC117630509 [Prunus dulcis]|uniref:uncharacterized protein LOC117630509 n=1 Tax=Prunus dulcis TaxID=3755 RepID=UPI0014827A1F|nr:uncharacterized protein LOC117630509 [Prunus dulcis]